MSSEGKGLEPGLPHHTEVSMSPDCDSGKPDGRANPLVSVVVTTYNRASILALTLESILSQTFTDFELIVVDNMSGDGTNEMLEGIGDSRLKYFRNPNDGIISVNRNVGINKARGKYIAFCDDDDLWFGEKLAKQVALMESSADAGLCYTNGASFCDAEVVQERILNHRVCDNFFHELLRSNFIPTSSVMIRSSILPRVGLFNEQRNIVTVEDYEMWLRIAHQYPLVFIDEPLIRYRIHKGGNLGQRKRKFVLQVDLLRSIRSKCDLMAPYYYKVLLRQWVQYMYRTLRIMFAE